MKNNRNFKRLLKKQNKQIVVLLGAGTALDWGGITTPQIRDIFIRDTTYILSNGITFGQYLFDVLDEYYKSNPNGANFETFIAALEAIMNYIINQTNSIAINYTSAIFNLKKRIEILFAGKTIDEKRGCVGELFCYYINLVIKEIDKYNKLVLEDKYSNLNYQLLSFTRYFLNRGYSVKFYTTNYDSLIPQILSPYMNVYEGLFNLSLSGKQFNYNLNRFREARVSHFNIHGSIFLHQIPGIQYETLYSQSRQSLSFIAPPLIMGNPLEQLPFSPIITGYNKTQRMVNKPFNLGFSALTNDLNDCRGLLTVGYSFSDPHINSLLSSFTSWNKAKYIHVTKMKGMFDTVTNREDFNLDYSVTRMIKKDEDSTWFHDVSGKKHIYKEGFGKFLGNNLNWRNLLP